jgi:hypothetical protein
MLISLNVVHFFAHIKPYLRVIANIAQTPTRDIPTRIMRRMFPPTKCPTLWFRKFRMVPQMAATIAASAVAAKYASTFFMLAPRRQDAERVTESQNV